MQYPSVILREFSFFLLFLAFLFFFHFFFPFSFFILKFPAFPVILKYGRQIKEKNARHTAKGESVF